MALSLATVCPMPTVLAIQWQWAFRNDGMLVARPLLFYFL
jgi:hypothetical protein